ncbi:MAG: hypothetical protein QXS20_07245 [Candidatus Thorarchaeota archaeon]
MFQVDTRQGSWTWIPVHWIVVYSTLNLASMILEAMTGTDHYLQVMTIGIPVLVAPVVYRRLAGGACSLRFHVCAFMKGLLVGVLLVVQSVGADLVLGTYLGVAVILGLSSPRSETLVYGIWLISALIGGLGARVSEVRQASVGQ